MPNCRTWLAGEAFPTLTQGRQKFGGTEFEIGPGVVQFACAYFPLMDTKFAKQFLGLKVGRKCRTLHFLHARRWGGDKEILADYLIHFANGLTWEIPVTSLNLGDVRYSGDETGGVKGSIVVWKGTNSSARSAFPNLVGEPAAGSRSGKDRPRVRHEFLSGLPGGHYC